MKSKLTNEQVLNRIVAQFGSAILTNEEPYGLLTI